MNTTPTEDPKIVVIDDHKMVRDGLRLLLQQERGWQVVGEADGPAEALERVRSLLPDIVLLDIKLDGGNGIELCRQMLGERPELLIIILSGLVDETLVHAALKAGARGFLLKTNAGRDIIQAIATVRGGGAYFCRHASEAIARFYKGEQTGNAAAQTKRVTHRERDVWKLTAEGWRVKEIASRLSIGVKTVETHRAQLLKKLDCSGTAELTRRAIKEGVSPL